MSQDHASPGATLTAAGEWYAADCYDTGQPGAPPALSGLSVHVVQGGRTWSVASGVAATGDRYRIEVPITLPTDLRLGEAEIRVDNYASTTLQITSDDS